MLVSSYAVLLFVMLSKLRIVLRCSLFRVYSISGVSFSFMFVR